MMTVTDIMAGHFSTSPHANRIRDILKLAANGADKLALHRASTLGQSLSGVERDGLVEAVYALLRHAKESA